MFSQVWERVSSHIKKDLKSVNDHYFIYNFIFLNLQKMMARNLSLIFLSKTSEDFHFCINGIVLGRMIVQKLYNLDKYFILINFTLYISKVLTIS